MTRDTVRLGEREQVDERLAPSPVCRKRPPGARRGEQVVGNPGSDEVTVRLVNYESDITLSSQLREGYEVRRRVYRARLGVCSASDFLRFWEKTYWVVRRTEHDGLRLRGDQCRASFRRRQKSFLSVCMQQHRLDAEHCQSHPKSFISVQICC